MKIRTRFLACSLCALMFGALAFSQTASTSAFPSTTITMNLSPIKLPGFNASVTGAETDVMVAPSTVFEVGSSTLVSSSMIFTGGRANYFIKPISTFIQNHSPNLNGYQFQVGPTFSLGVVKPVGELGTAHWAERAGMILNYGINGNWGLGMDVEWGNFPGVAHNTWTLAFGPNFHF